ncbi:DNA repair protein RAD51 homolog 2-like [Cylas formicarius]|uniref:DNA repair protein RAD51 homolog 2-like n=1 Tax=Cylas formicarius TaxID=197179 RepID=UPI0029585119|nr:DNA repair protein RAD51 homolog 2-like [Cylas formicarius]XP_060528591.1 DNA repair protein RAD51 homolog 2-like [Cylas formicarius]XP_060528592.1 DNA repair protein RAD51 homolog 2-like [Cylas formicarius]
MLLLSTIRYEPLTQDMIEVLNKKRIFTVLEFLRCDNNVLSQILPLTYQEINESKRFLTKTFAPEATNAFESYKTVLTKSVLILTGIKSIDDLLHGGILTGNIYEFCGLPACGKTRLCSKIINKNLLLGIGIFVLDTKQEFGALQIKNALDPSSNEDLTSALEHIFVHEITTKFQLVSSLFDIKRQIENGKKVRLIFVDSLSVLFLGSKDFVENNNILNHTANILRFLVNEYHVAVIVTNLMTQWFDDVKDSSSLRETVACGKYWYNVPDIRLKLEKLADTTTRATLLKDDHHIASQMNTCTFEFDCE